MRKLTAMIVASTLAMSAASFAFAADTTVSDAAPDTTQSKMMHHKGMHHPNPFAGLNLTEAQRTQMRELMKESGPHHQRGEMRTQMDALHKLVATDSFDEAKVKSQIDEITQAQSAHMLERAKVENKMYNLLTPEQKKQFNENYQKRAEKMAERMAEHKKHQADAAQSAPATAAPATPAAAQ
ncbi:ATP-independent periplasmic protein-refolding chaperone Spy [Rouxiella sp. Mn2063]|uniref:ATP-independent periplasmic protein-refolding chaperone Spy n=1 Tax=Rouxiella sp. Mn2063 TaxID=3395262 RepID=UPI003BBA97A0